MNEDARDRRAQAQARAAFRSRAAGLSPGLVWLRGSTTNPDFPDRIGLSSAALPLQLRRNPRARALSLRLSVAARAAILTLPPQIGARHARAFLEAHRDWLDREVQRRLPPPVVFVPGTTLPVAGSDILLGRGRGRRALRHGHMLAVPGEGPVYAVRVARWLQDEALALLQAETAALAATLGKPLRGVRVGDFRSRWGSCSSDGRIAYSWRLLLAPAFVRRAVVAHEVAHLAVPSHSREFWALATVLLGHPHDEARCWLRENAGLLAAYGASC